MTTPSLVTPVPPAPTPPVRALTALSTTVAPVLGGATVVVPFAGAPRWAVEDMADPPSPPQTWPQPGISLQSPAAGCVASDLGGSSCPSCSAPTMATGSAPPSALPTLVPLCTPLTSHTCSPGTSRSRARSPTPISEDPRILDRFRLGAPRGAVADLARPPSDTETPHPLPLLGLGDLPQPHLLALAPSLTQSAFLPLTSREAGHEAPSSGTQLPRGVGDVSAHPPTSHEAGHQTPPLGTQLLSGVGNAAGAPLPPLTLRPLHSAFSFALPPHVSCSHTCCPHPSAPPPTASPPVSHLPIPSPTTTTQPPPPTSGLAPDPLSPTSPSLGPSAALTSSSACDQPPTHTDDRPAPSLASAASPPTTHPHPIGTPSPAPDLVSSRLRSRSTPPPPLPARTPSRPRRTPYTRPTPTDSRDDDRPHPPPSDPDSPSSPSAWTTLLDDLAAGRGLPHSLVAHLLDACGRRSRRGGR